MTFTRNRKYISIGFITFLLLFLGGGFFMPQALAIESSNYVKELADKMTVFHQFFGPFVNWFALQIGNLFGTEYLYSGAMEEMLKNLWVISRNLVNVFFVGILLWVAIKAIFGDFFGEETDLKKELLKIAVFLVLVNFSWLGTKVILDASNVATHIAFSLPSGVSNVATIDLGKCTLNEASGLTEGACKPTAIYPGSADPNKVKNLTHQECVDNKVNEAYKDIYPNGIGGPINPAADPDHLEAYEGRSTFCWGHLDLFDYNQNTAVVYLTYGMANIQNLGGAHAAGEDILKMSLASMFSVLIQATYTLSLLALFILMLFRMAILWLFIGFSPALVVMLYLGGGENPVSNFGPKDFIKWAFVPAQVGIILSVGFIMVAAGRANSDLLQSLNQNINLEGGFNETIAIFSGMDTTFNLIWLMIIELIFAMAVYIPMKDMPFASNIIGPIENFSKKTLTALAKTPIMAPILPTTNPDGTPGKNSSLYNTYRNFESTINWRDGLDADSSTITKLEADAKMLANNTSAQKDILNEARRTNKSIETLSKHMETKALGKLSEDLQRSIITMTMKDKNPKAIQDIMDAIKHDQNKSSSSKSTNNNAEANPRANGEAGAGGEGANAKAANSAAGVDSSPKDPTPASPPLTPTEQTALQTGFETLKGDKNLRERILAEARETTPRTDALSQELNLDHLKTKEKNELHEHLEKQAGFSDPEEREVLIEVIKK